MRHGILVPNLAEFAEPRRAGELARRAEEAGWDGFFVWDHVVFGYWQQAEVADPWVLLTVAALATERIQLGPMVTPPARRRPGTLARQTTTLDRLSGGRLVLGAGLGFTLEAEYGAWGDTTDARTLAKRFDESLDVLTALWSGETVNYQGEHLTVTDVTFAPTPVRRPPIWIGGNWPHKAPLRRAARWDGAVIHVNDPATGAWGTTPEIVTEIVAEVGKHRTSNEPFDVVLTGRTEPGQGTVDPFEAAGGTWWLEGFMPGPGEYETALRRIDAGPAS